MVGKSYYIAYITKISVLFKLLKKRRLVGLSA